MPVVINELIIRGIVGDQAEGKPAKPAGESRDNEAIMDEIMEQVMDRFNEKKER